MSIPQTLAFFWAMPLVHATVNFFAVMISMFLADMAWTRYFIATEKRAAVKAATWSTIIIVLGSFTTLEYVDNHWNVVAAIIGSFAGTWWTVNHQAKSETKDQAARDLAAVAVDAAPIPGIPGAALPASSSAGEAGCSA